MTAYEPEVARITKVEDLTSTEKLFGIELPSREGFDYKPGQFVEVSVFGVGEAPISISSPPTGEPRFELCIRAIGNVTNALHRKKPGDRVGIRGPFGRGFELRDFKGKDILFIAGGLGLAPLRSLIWSVLNSRRQFGEVFILYGARRPHELLFRNELRMWEERTDVKYLVTVDVADEMWKGNVGVITTLIPQIEFKPKKTRAVIVGPPIMYRFVIKSLKERGMPDENIFVSLERKMKCGLGKCGHCQTNHLYVCQDGPVFRYDEIKDIAEAI